MLRKIAKLQVLLLVMLTITLSLALPAYAADAPPAIPQQFYGSVTVNGSTAQGAAVSVRIGGTQAATATTDAQGKYSVLVSGASGATVEFYVGSSQASQTATLASGNITNLNLNVGSGSTPPVPTPPASTPPAPTPPASTPPPGNASSPASFTVLSLDVNPISVVSGEKVVVTADVKNSGSSEGSYKAVLKVNGATEAEQAVTVGPGKTQRVTFTVNKQNAGKYRIALEGETSSFTVLSSSGTSSAGPPWMLIFGGIGALLVIFLFAILILRRRASYF